MSNEATLKNIGDALDLAIAHFSRCESLSDEKLVPETIVKAATLIETLTKKYHQRKDANPEENYENDLAMLLENDTEIELWKQEAKVGDSRKDKEKKNSNGLEPFQDRVQHTPLAHSKLKTPIRKPRNKVCVTSPRNSSRQTRARAGSSSSLSNSSESQTAVKIPKNTSIGSSVNVCF